MLNATVVQRITAFSLRSRTRFGLAEKHEDNGDANVMHCIREVSTNSCSVRRENQYRHEDSKAIHLVLHCVEHTRVLYYVQSALSVSQRYS